MQAPTIIPPPALQLQPPSHHPSPTEPPSQPSSPSLEVLRLHTQGPDGTPMILTSYPPSLLFAFHFPAIISLSGLSNRDAAAASKSLALQRHVHIRSRRWVAARCDYVY